MTTDAATLAEKVRRARHRMFCDFAFFVGGTRENVDDLPKLERLEGSAGIKVFMGSSTGDLLVEDEGALDRILGRISRRAAFHAEDEARLKARLELRARAILPPPEWRDEEAALIATRRLVGLAEKHRKRVHVLHVSTAAEMAYLAALRDWASVEVTPHHLTLAAPDCYAELGTYAQMNPPFATSATVARCGPGSRAASSTYWVPTMPRTREEKEHAYPDSHSGMTGVQTLVPIMLDHVNAGRLSLERLVDLTSHGPQRLFGIRGKGRLAVGYDADLTVVDLKRAETITDSWIESRCGWTPYNGRRVTGWPVGTLVRGHRAMWEGGIAAVASGAPVRFFECA